MNAPRSEAGPPRVAVVCEGDPSDPAEWSGTPYGLLIGLQSCGVEAVPIAGDLPGSVRNLARDAVSVLTARPSSARPAEAVTALRTARRSAVHSATYGNIGTAYVAVGLCRRGPFDGVLQIGTSYGVRHPRLVTFEDMTVRQAVDHDQYHWAELPEAQLQERIKRQKLAYSRGVAALTATPWAARSVVRDYDVPAHRVAAVGVGRNHDIAEVDRRWDRPRFLFVGQDWQRKNGDAVVRAFRAVRDAFPDATLDLVGGHPRIDAPGVRGHGRLALGDPQSHRTLTGLFDQSTCLVVPSRFEAAGIVYLEAGAAGIPSIGANRGGAPDLIGEGGLIVAPDDPAELVAAMTRMADGGTARRLGLTAKERSRDFTWSAVARRVLAHMRVDGYESTPPRW